MRGSGFMKGIAAGMAVGAAVTLMVDSSSRGKKKYQREPRGFFAISGTPLTAQWVCGDNA